MAKHKEEDQFEWLEEMLSRRNERNPIDVLTEFAVRAEGAEGAEGNEGEQSRDAEREETRKLFTRLCHELDTIFPGFSIIGHVAFHFWAEHELKQRDLFRRARESINTRV